MLSFAFVLSLFFYLDDSSVVFVQVAQQIFVAKEWVRDTRNEANVADLALANVEKYLGAFK